MAKAICKTAKYCMRFTAAGLKPELAAVMARIHAERGIGKKRVPCCLSALRQRLASGQPLALYRYM